VETVGVAGELVRAGIALGGLAAWTLVILLIAG
jgi:hypothetical protein